MKKLVIAFVLYLPDVDTINNCIKHKNEFGVDIVVWNNNPPDLSDDRLIQQLFDEDIVVIGQGENVGLGRSVNGLCEWAIDNGYRWVLTLDQDSSVKYLRSELLGSFEEVGCAWIGVKDHCKKLFFSKKIFCIQSGSVLSPEAIIGVGGLNADLFIDHVDHEICIRLQVRGYSVLCEDVVSIDHALGKKKDFFACSFSSHTFKRFRYFVRNGFYCLRIFPEYSFYFIPQVVKEFIKQLLVFNFSAFLSVFKDTVDGLRSKLGEIK